MMPKVSVIIPSYNHAAYLPAALESVLAQSFKDYEVVVVDDGSTDATQDAVKPYLSRIHFHPLAHAGITATYNRGIALAKGEIVAFLESDDAWAPEFLERAVEVIERDTQVCGVVVCRKIIVSTEKGKVQAVGLMQKRSPGNLYTTESILGKRDWEMVGTPVVRRSCVDELGGYNENFAFAGELDFALRLSLNHKLAYLDQPLYLYRLHERNTTRDVLTYTQSVLEVVLHFAKEHPEVVRAYPRTVRRCLGKLHGQVGALMLKETHRRNVARRDVLPFFAQAMRYQPFCLKHYRRCLMAFLLGPRVCAGIKKVTENLRRHRRLTGKHIP